MLNFGPARRRDVESLQNWLDGTGCLAREEAEYLTHHREIVSLGPAGDNAIMQLEAWVEDKLIRFYRGFRKVRENRRPLLQANELNRAAFMMSRSMLMYMSIPAL
jgi:hypothetical protein